MMSVDIGDWSKKLQQAGSRALEPTPDELAHEVPRRITTELGAPLGEDESDLGFPQPRWYWIDKLIEYKDGTAESQCRAGPDPDREGLEEPARRLPVEPERNILHVETGTEMCVTQKNLGVWQAGDGGYQVHFDKLVFAGTWTKTFTWMTSMEAASESGATW